MLSVNDYYTASDVAYRRERITRDWAAATHSGKHHGTAPSHRRWFPRLRQWSPTRRAEQHHGRATVA